MRIFRRPLGLRANHGVFLVFVLPYPSTSYNLSLQLLVKILNINIAECYLSWYNGTYKALENTYQRDLLLLCAAMYTKKTEEFLKCISEISMEKYLKEEMEEVCTRMNDDEELKVRYYDFLEETKALKEAIIREEKRKSKKEGLVEGQALKEKEMIINMYNDNLDINIIAKYANTTIDEVKNIIKRK